MKKFTIPPKKIKIYTLRKIENYLHNNYLVSQSNALFDPFKSPKNQPDYHLWVIRLINSNNFFTIKSSISGIKQLFPPTPIPLSIAS